eukprot:CAMPEP_0178779464 /NCGR_PEP_ID=MMETSP0745-20121128/1539_1 /TAXON_ID=913974 /ORGANISM="Nitzschia punctata, Strain CCMP561" /LENGTH=162 /DNA_ID=CAMNT_0020436657 /DNA_START=5 /DNA_END=493 /DNA_ORIENTATION=+
MTTVSCCRHHTNQERVWKRTGQLLVVIVAMTRCYLSGAFSYNMPLANGKWIQACHGNRFHGLGNFPATDRMVAAVADSTFPAAVGCWELAASPSQNNDMNDLSELQSQLCWIEALEERNAAQMDSFVDEQDQWESMESWEQELLLQKDSILERIHELSKKGE